MAHVIETTAGEFPVAEETGQPTAGLVKRTLVMAYGLLGYAVGVSGLAWLLLAAAGLAPVGLGLLKAESTLSAAMIDLGLILFFGVQHSVMAREGFKKRLTRLIPQAAERATYMLASGFVAMTALYYWQPLPGMVWSVETDLLRIGIWGLFALGWGYLFVATFVTNHFELMGLRQVYLYFTNKPYTSLPFTRKFMYRYSRHPMMLGFLVGLWAVPEMSVTHFSLAALLTMYVAVGMFFEERDLVKRFGDTYRRYKQEIATFLPGMY